MFKPILTLGFLMLVACTPISISIGTPPTATPPPTAIPTALPTVTATPTATATPDVTATAQALATATAQAQQTANAQASATANAQATATAQARASATSAAAIAQANATATTQAASAATRTAILAYVDALVAKAGRPWRNTNGKLEGQQKIFNTGLNLRNFVADIEFTNPADPKAHNWDLMFMFRFSSVEKRYFLLIHSTGVWQLMYPDERKADRTVVTTIAEGRLPTMKLGATDSNKVRLIVNEGTAFLFVNDAFTAMMDVSQHNSGGELMISTGMMMGDDFPGLSLQYKEFVVAGLP